MVTLDPHLTFNDHIVNTVSSCMSHLGQINRVKHAFDRRTLITVLNAWFLVNCVITGIQTCGLTPPTVTLTNYNLYRTSHVEL